MAQRCGDDTPRLSGRLTLNPAKHLDLLGTVCLLLFGFGWAKPVPVNINNFKEKKKGLFLVSIAGVTTNLIIAFFAIAFSVGLAFISVNFMEAMLASSILYYVIMYVYIIFIGIIAFQKIEML
jgi:Zn-dependent protease